MLSVCSLFFAALLSPFAYGVYTLSHAAVVKFDLHRPIHVFFLLDECGMARFEVIDTGGIEVSDRLRKELGDVEKLAENIGRNGLIHPILVREEPPGEHVLIAGYRRLKACRHFLGWEKIPAQVLEKEEEKAWHP